MFGGTRVGEPEKIRNVARSVDAFVDSGAQPPAAEVP
jgi:aspartokinase